MFSNGIAVFTFGTVHTAIPLKMFAIERIYELFMRLIFFVEQCLHKLSCQTAPRRRGPASIRTNQWPKISALRSLEFWFSNQFLPSLDKGTVVVMDNASFHSQRRLFSAAQNAGCKLLFLPPYSPELNPIEKFWAWLKRFLRKILPSAISFDEALFTAFQLW